MGSPPLRGFLGRPDGRTHTSQFERETLCERSHTDRRPIRFFWKSKWLVRKTMRQDLELSYAKSDIFYFARRLGFSRWITNCLRLLPMIDTPICLPQLKPYDCHYFAFSA
jgi:hypothetical protein